MRLQRELAFLRRFTIPATILIGLFLLLRTPVYYAALTPGARAYTLCAFALFFGGLANAALGSLGATFGRDALRWWPLVRVLNGVVVLAAFALGPADAPTPVPAGLLVALATTLLASCWWPPRSPAG
jgi:hypothetical protein